MDKNSHNNSQKRSWWKKYAPTRIRQNIKLILFTCIGLLLCGFYFGDYQIKPVVFSTDYVFESNIVNNIEGTVDFFDYTQPHTLELFISEESYQIMQTELEDSGEKAWIVADAIIDGAYIPSVGLRLKGNSTVMGLRGGFPGMGGEGFPGMPEGGFPGMEGGGFPGMGEGGFEMPEDGVFPGFPGMPEGMEMPEGFEDMMADMAESVGDMMNASTFDDPQTLPLLMSINEFMPGRGYQGRTEFAIRSTTAGGTNLNEALALELLKNSAQKSQRYTWINLSINDQVSTTRLVIENPDQNYALSLISDSEGVLYKSRSSNAFIYKGEDPTEYENDFAQLNAIDSLDLAPVIGLLRWLDTVEDDKFAEELPDWINIKSFSYYVATHELLNNFDDMAGPGRNFLLWYDLDTKLFDVITWDLNLAIEGFPVPMEGMMNGDFGAFPMPGNFGPPPAGFAPPEGFTPPPGFTPPDGANPPADFPPGFAPPNGTEDGMAAAFPFPFPGGEGMGEFPDMMEGMGMVMGNSLKDKFTANPEFASLIEESETELKALWFESGMAVELLEQLSEYVPLNTVLTEELRATETEAVKSQLETLTN